MNVCIIPARGGSKRISRKNIKDFDTLMENICDYVIPVTSYPFPIQRAIKTDEQDRVEMFQPKYFNARPQDLEEAWHDAG